MRPFLDELEKRGFEVFNDLTMLTPADNFLAVIERELRRAADAGWVVAFLTQRSLQSPWVQREIQFALSLRAKFVPVVIDGEMSQAMLPPHLQMVQAFDATKDRANAPSRLASELHQRNPS